MLKRSFEGLNDNELEEEVLDVLYELKYKKHCGHFTEDDEEKFLDSIRNIPEDNAIYCDDGIEELEHYIEDVIDYITYATKEDKEQFFNYIEQIK